MDSKKYTSSFGPSTRFVCQAIPNPDFGKTTNAEGYAGNGDKRSADTPKEIGGPNAKNSDSDQGEDA